MFELNRKLKFLLDMFLRYVCLILANTVNRSFLIFVLMHKLGIREDVVNYQGVNENDGSEHI